MEFSQYIPFWEGLRDQQRQRIADVIEYRSVPKGAHIHDSSAECLGLVIVKTGQLRAYILSEDGREITLEFLKFLRPEIKFPSLGDLQEAVRADGEKTKEILKTFSALQWD